MSAIPSREEFNRYIRLDQNGDLRIRSDKFLTNGEVRDEFRNGFFTGSTNELVYRGNSIVASQGLPNHVIVVTPDDNIKAILENAYAERDGALYAVTLIVNPGIYTVSDDILHLEYETHIYSHGAAEFQFWVQFADDPPQAGLTASITGINIVMNQSLYNALSFLYAANFLDVTINNCKFSNDVGTCIASSAGFDQPISFNDCAIVGRVEFDTGDSGLVTFKNSQLDLTSTANLVKFNGSTNCVLDNCIIVVNKNFNVNGTTKINNCDIQYDANDAQIVASANANVTLNENIIRGDFINTIIDINSGGVALILSATYVPDNVGTPVTGTGTITKLERTPF